MSKQVDLKTKTKQNRKTTMKQPRMSNYNNKQKFG